MAMPIIINYFYFKNLSLTIDFQLKFKLFAKMWFHLKFVYFFIGILKFQLLILMKVIIFFEYLLQNFHHFVVIFRLKQHFIV